MKSDTIQTNETNDQAGPMPTAEEVEPNEGTSGPPSVQELEARQIPLSEIVPSQLNPREILAETPMGELVKSIERMDVLEPLVVRRYRDGYQIVCGERRYKALKRLGRGRAPPASCVSWRTTKRSSRCCRRACTESRSTP